MSRACYDLLLAKQRTKSFCHPARAPSPVIKSYLMLLTLILLLSTGYCSSEGTEIRIVDMTEEADSIEQDSPDQTEIKTEVCPICLSPVTESPFDLFNYLICDMHLAPYWAHHTVKTTCNHLYHGDCLLSWIPRRATCPTCRGALLPPDDPISRHLLTKLRGPHQLPQNHLNNGAGGHNGARDERCCFQLLKELYQLISGYRIE